MECKGYVLLVPRYVHESVSEDHVALLVGAGYEVRCLPPGGDPVAVILADPPLVVCFQYDYPNTRGLAEIRLVKVRAPAVPILMITRSHSEQLAVWAFRSRVWDYFVEPIERPRFLSVLETLKGIRTQGKLSAECRYQLEMTNTIPPEARQHYCEAQDDRVIIGRALTFLDANLHKKVVQADVAAVCGLSAFQFSRMFRRVANMTFQDYLLQRRIEEAKRLLANPRASVTDICFTVGFRDLSYFSRIFQRYVGASPSRYRLSLEACQAKAPCPAKEPSAAVPPMDDHSAPLPSRPAVAEDITV